MNPKSILISLVLLTIAISVNGQEVDKIAVRKGEDFLGTYMVIQPSTSPIVGFMVLLSGLGQSPENLLIQTDLPDVAKEKGILTIIPTLQDGFVSLGIDSTSQKSLFAIIEDATIKFSLSDVSFYIGGFSIGGSCAVKYAENANKYEFDTKPDAIFAIDPPLDFERFYHSRKRENRLNYPAEPSRENSFMTDRLEQIMGGDPRQALRQYQQTSPYSMSDTSQMAIKTLINTPIRIYTEPDVNWWIEQRGGDLSGMNALDCSAMINELRRLGNKNAKLIATINRGFRRPDNRRHPHSWSIVESNELVQWLLSKD